MLTNINRPLELLNLKFPYLREGQVLVRVCFSTICGSQLHEIAGERGRDKHIPHLLGHEGYGIVEEIGQGVSRFKPGDRVILTWVTQAGLDCNNILFESDTGRKVSAGKVTTFSEYTVVAENKLFKAPEIANPEILPLLGCAVLTGAGMVIEKSREISRALVVGAGGVGIFSILALLSLGTEEIHVIEKSVPKQKFISQFDSRILVYSGVKDESFIEDVKKRGNFPFVFETTGSIDSLQEAISLTTKSGELTFCSHPKVGDNLIIDPLVLIRGMKVLGSWGGGCENELIRDEAVKVALSYEDHLPSVLSMPYGLSAINVAIEEAKKGNNFRTLLELGSSS